MKDFIGEHPNWDQYQVMSSALAHFLFQNGCDDRAVTDTGRPVQPPGRNARRLALRLIAIIVSVGLCMDAGQQAPSTTRTFRAAQRRFSWSTTPSSGVKAMAAPPTSWM